MFFHNLNQSTYKKLDIFFTKLEKSDNIFRLLVAYDYFCIPIGEIYKYIFENSFYLYTYYLFYKFLYHLLNSILYKIHHLIPQLMP